MPPRKKAAAAKPPASKKAASAASSSSRAASRSSTRAAGAAARPSPKASASKAASKPGRPAAGGGGASRATKKSSGRPAATSSASSTPKPKPAASPPSRSPPPARSPPARSPKHTAKAAAAASRVASSPTLASASPPAVASPAAVRAKAASPKSRKRAAPASAASKPAKTARTTMRSAPRRSVPAPVYEEVWKEVYLAGTEWDQMKDVYAIDWDFDHLDDALNEGDLANKKVHLFGCTEPQLLRRDEKDDKGTVIPIPVIVAVVCDSSPPATVGIKSVQRATEEIVPMTELRMSWQPYAPPNVSHRPTFKPLIYVLTCTQRKARLRNMGEEDVHKYDYVLPYFLNPEKVDDVDENTVVQVLADLEGQQAPLMCEFDYEMDDLAEFVEETLKLQELDEDKHGEPLKKSIREAVRATKLKYKSERLDRQKRIDAIPEEEKDAIKSMKLIKFYPSNEWPDVSSVKSRFINRYYGQASEVL